MKEKKHNELSEKPSIQGFNERISVEGLLDRIFELIRNASISAFYRSLSDHRIVYANAYFSKTFRLPLGEWEKTPYLWTDFVAPVDKESYRLYFEGLKTPQYSLDYRLIDELGQPRWVQEEGTVLFPKHSEGAMVLALIHDISEHKRIEAELYGNEERLNRVLTDLHVGLWDWDIPNKRYFGNGFWTQMFGFQPGTFTTDEAAWAAIVHPDDFDHFLLALEDPLTGKADQFSTEYRVRTLSGDWKWILDQGKVIDRDPLGRPVRLIGTIVDITAQKERQTELMHAKVKAEKASREKSELLASVNHDLKTPLTVILGAVETLLQESTAPTKPLLEMIHSNTRRLEKMVGALLEIHQIELGMPTSLAKAIRTKRLFEDCNRNYTQLAKKKNLSYEQRIAQDIPKTIILDQDRFLKVLNNLVDNAVKYTREGSVRLEVGYIPVEAGNARGNRAEGELHVSVSDTGVGIPEAYLPYVFDRFFRVPNKGGRGRSPGFGLGLSICRDLVEQMGGAISIKPAEKGGTTAEFYVRVKEGNGAS